MEKINIAELLKDCPSGMELNCTMFDNVTFVRIDNNRNRFPIEITVGDLCSKYLTKEGCFHDNTAIPEAKCVIFPKGKTTWEGFHRPFKNGDIIAFDSRDGAQLFIFKEYICYNNNYAQCYMMLDWDGAIDFGGGRYYVERFATEEEKAKLFKSIRDNGYKWNPDTKTLEKLIEPKFKEGDEIKHRLTGDIYEVMFVRLNGCGDGEYDVAITNEIGKSIDFKEQDNYELVPNKFDINTLIPFESRVLVRPNRDDKWCGSFFSHIDENFHLHGSKFVTTAVKSYPMCIPYEGNEHLLGTTNDCDEYFKVWK